MFAGKQAGRNRAAFEQRLRHLHLAHRDQRARTDRTRGAPLAAGRTLPPTAACGEADAISDEMRRQRDFGRAPVMPGTMSAGESAKYRHAARTRSTTKHPRYAP